MEKEKLVERLAAVEQARERGWITLEELMELASGSPVDLDDATDLARAAGIELVKSEGDDGWQDIETLADKGPGAFTAFTSADIALLGEFTP